MLYIGHMVTMEALDAEGNSSNMPVIAQFLLLFLYVGYIVFALNADSNINSARAKRGLPPKDNKILYLILGIFCPIVLVGDRKSVV